MGIYTIIIELEGITMPIKVMTVIAINATA
jgi:hypothetical protein